MKGEKHTLPLLGKIEIYVSELCLGTMTFGGKGFCENIGKLTQTAAETLIGELFGHCPLPCREEAL